VPLVPLLDTNDDDFERAWQTNVAGAFRLTRAVAGGMLVAGRGLILNVTSDAATAAYSGWGAYGITKAALEHFGRVLAVELEGSGIRVLTIDPGEMDTRMHADAMPEANRDTLKRPADVASQIVRLIEEGPAPESGARVSL
jgi:NAD(P)-dependent dehydrogenase (short-subunit alcohol dehydrogenase family)